MGVDTEWEIKCRLKQRAQPITFGSVGRATGNTGSRDFQFSGRINF
jgi:hypothetical protein